MYKYTKLVQVSKYLWRVVTKMPDGTLDTTMAMPLVDARKARDTMEDIARTG